MKYGMGFLAGLCLAAALLIVHHVMQPASAAANPLVAAAEPQLSVHQALLESENRQKCDLLFLGDSITDFWARVPWEWRRFSEFNALNEGIAYDQIQHVLWRVEHGEMDHISPKLVVLMIGTNNLALGHDSPKQVAAGVSHLVDAVHLRQPRARVILLALLPRADATGKLIEPTNLLLSGIERPWLQFVRLPLGLADLGDGLHPSPEGYQKWADALIPILKRNLGGREYLPNR